MQESAAFSMNEGHTDWKPFIRFTAVGKELFFIYLRNFFLTLITLGIYSFWGKVNVRKYLWQSTHFLDEPLEYTGTGKELFFSFLIVFPLFILFVAVSMFLIEVHQLFGLIIYIVGIMFLMNYAVYRTLRYRLTRTRWRGIRCNLAGAPSQYALWATGYTFAILFSGFLLLPWGMARLTSLLTKNIMIGKTQMQFLGRAKSLFVPYFLYLGGCILLVVALISLMISMSVQSAFYQYIFGGEIDHILPILCLIYGCFIIIYLFESFWAAAVVRWYYGGLVLDQLRMRSTLSAMGLFKVRATNLLLLIFSLGIGYAWTHVRLMRLVFHSVDYTGTLDALAQNTQKVPSSGEGLLEALDIDLGF